MCRLTINKILRAAAICAVGSAASNATPCINVVDLGGLFAWGQAPVAGQGNLLPFRMAFDAATGATHAFGMIDANGAPAVGAWRWDGFEWTARDTTPLTSQFTGLPAGTITGFAIDPDTRIAVLLTRTVNALDFAYAFNIDDFSAPLIPLGQIFDFGAAVRSEYAAFASDEGVFYFFNRVSGVIRFDPETGSLTPTGAAATGMPPNTESECVYDRDQRRVVIVESLASPPRTLIYSLDSNTLVDATNPATAPPPGGTLAHRLVTNSSTGDVFLVAIRVSPSAPIPTDALYRLDGDADWTIIDTFSLSGSPIFFGTPAASFDERVGQIILAGGWSLVGGMPVSDVRNQAIRFEAPQFASPPMSVSAKDGASAALVGVPSANSLYSSVVWRKDGQIVAETGIPVLMFPSVAPGDAGTYTAKMTGLCGSTVSQEFTLTVTCPADSDGNGAITFADLNAVLSAFGQTCP